jgi:glycosyltransferase involved in cell wall biosynthesis
MLQGEDYFLDSLPQAQRDLAWQTLAQRCAEVDLFIAPSRYFGELMSKRLHLPDDRVRVVFNGINLDGFEVEDRRSSVKSRAPDQPSTLDLQPSTPVLGYFARMCREKGLDRLVEAFILLKRREQTKNLRLRIGGGCGPSDEPLVESLRDRLKTNGVLHDVEFHPNPDRAAKLELLRSLTVFCVPALYGEAFGLYVIEALASGVPVVQPRVASFPELVGATGGGVLYDPGDVEALANAVESLVLNPDRRQALGDAGRRCVLQDFTAARMAQNITREFERFFPHLPATKYAAANLELVNRKS